jgi:WXXGXW repeat (2 copies)
LQIFSIDLGGSYGVFAAGGISRTRIDRAGAIMTRNRIPAIGSLIVAFVGFAGCSSYGGPPRGEYVEPAPRPVTVITYGPPDLPVYEQPECPGDQYVWTPGYWAWEGGDYYWVPGTWVEAPEVGYLWTPAYWAWGGNSFVFHEGYWGERVGFYGGINYGYGYGGHGFEGGRWDNGRYYHNQSVTNVNVTNVHNVYNTTVVNNTTIVNNTVTRVSYSGGNGGVNERPTADEQAAAQVRHIPPVAAQTEHLQIARTNPQLRASANQGKPPIAATPKAGAFSDAGVVAAKEAGAVHNPPAQPQGNAARPAAPSPPVNAARPAGAVHPNDLPPVERPAAPNTGDPKLDQQYQQQHDELVAHQNQERVQLQQKQDEEHQRMAQQKTDAAATQKLEEQHKQQTQQLAQQHAQQTQALKARQQQPPKEQANPPKDKP